jgi:hypothetical protein
MRIKSSLVFVLLAGLGMISTACKTAPKPVPVQKTVSRAAEAKAEKLYIEGVYAYGRGDTDTAIQAWKRVLVLDPRHKKAKAGLQEALAKAKAVKSLTGP